MKIFSEKTKKFYDDIPACEKAEAEFDEAQAKAEAERKAYVEERKRRAKEVEDAYNTAQALYKPAREADRKYIELRNAFIKDFGSFHMTIRNSEIPINNPFDDFFKYFFN